MVVLTALVLVNCVVANQCGILSLLIACRSQGCALLRLSCTPWRVAGFSPLLLYGARRPPPMIGRVRSRAAHVRCVICS